MRTFSRNLRLAALTSAPLIPLTSAAGKPGNDGAGATAITRQLNRYEQALNASDTEAVMQLYAEDAVFMPQHSLPEHMAQTKRDYASGKMGRLDGVPF